MEDQLSGISDAIDQYGYIFLFGLLVLENTVFLGFLVPGFSVLLFAGFYVHYGGLELGWVYIVALVGTLVGDNISYWIGRFAGTRYFARFPAYIRLDVVQLSVLLTHFSAYLRMSIPVSSGLLKLPYWRWFSLNMVGAVIWVAVYVFLGYWAGQQSRSFDWIAERVKPATWLGLILFIAIVVLLIRLSKKHQAYNRGQENI